MGRRATKMEVIIPPSIGPQHKPNFVHFRASVSMLLCLVWISTQNIIISSKNIDNLNVKTRKTTLNRLKKYSIATHFELNKFINFWLWFIQSGDCLYPNNVLASWIVYSVIQNRWALAFVSRTFYRIRVWMWLVCIVWEHCKRHLNAVVHQIKSFTHRFDSSPIKRIEMSIEAMKTMKMKKTVMTRRSRI